MFFNEYDVLEGRLQYLYDHVDYFVIVESNITHAGNPKPLNFLQNMSRYKQYLDKIIYSPFHINPADFDFDKQITSLDLGHAAWQVEHLQRDHITQTLKFFNDYDVVMVGDCDEIPDQRIIPELGSVVHNSQHNLCVLGQNMFYYNFKKLRATDWYGTTVTFNGLARQTGTQWLRDYRAGFNFIPNAGWHISYWGDEHYIQTKIKNFSHQEYNYSEFTDLSNIKTAIDSGTDLYNRPTFAIDFDETALPIDFYSIFDKISYKPQN